MYCITTIVTDKLQSNCSHFPSKHLLLSVYSCFYGTFPWGLFKGLLICVLCRYYLYLIYTVASFPGVFLCFRLKFCKFQLEMYRTWDLLNHWDFGVVFCTFEHLLGAVLPHCKRRNNMQWICCHELCLSMNISSIVLWSFFSSITVTLR